MENDFNNHIRQLSQAGRFQTAVKEILNGLDNTPGDAALLSLAAITLDMAQSKNKAYSALEPLTTELINDSRLDSIFCQCEKCGNTWVPNPLFTMLGLGKGSTSYNPSGGVCPKCKKVFCKNCSASIGDIRSKCPQCHTELEPITQPNGRSPRQSSRQREAVKYAIILREGPVPLDKAQLTKLFHELSPEVIGDKAKTSGLPIIPWPVEQSELLEEILKQCARWKIIPREDGLVSSLFHLPDGKRLLLVKIYHPKRLPTEAVKQSLDNLPKITKPESDSERPNPQEALLDTITGKKIAGQPITLSFYKAKIDQTQVSSEKVGRNTFQTTTKTYKDIEKIDVIVDPKSYNRASFFSNFAGWKGCLITILSPFIGLAVAIAIGYAFKQYNLAFCLILLPALFWFLGLYFHKYKQNLKTPENILLRKFTDILWMQGRINSENDVLFTEAEYWNMKSSK